MPVTATSDEPIMKSTWISLRLSALGGLLVVGRVGVRRAERDVARRVLVEERVEEDRVERTDPALAVDERELAEARGALVRGAIGGGASRRRCRASIATARPPSKRTADP